MCRDRLPFRGWTVLRCLDGPHLVYPSLDNWLWTRGLFLVFGCCERCCWEHRCADTCSCRCSRFSVVELLSKRTSYWKWKRGKLESPLAPGLCCQQRPATWRDAKKFRKCSSTKLENVGLSWKSFQKHGAQSSLLVEEKSALSPHLTGDGSSVLVTKPGPSSQGQRQRKLKPWSRCRGGIFSAGSGTAYSLTPCDPLAAHGVHTRASPPDGWGVPRGTAQTPDIQSTRRCDARRGGS